MQTFDEFETALEDVVEAAARNRDALAVSPPDELYHYTDVPGLLAILDSKCFRATNTRYMNDAGESLLIKDVTASIAIDLLTSCENDWSRELLTYLKDPNWTGPVAVYETFATCFSSKPDVLSQWCMYANDGLGYSIGISSAERFYVEDKQARSPTLFPIEYRPDSQDQMIRPYISRIAQIVAQQSNGKASVEERNRAIFYAGVALHRAIIPFGPLVKHPGFAHEHEWRMLVNFVGSYKRSSLKFRATRFGVTPYVEFGRLGERLPIRTVACGPRLHSQEARSGLVGLLQQHDYDVRNVKFEASSTPYR